jgi:hypothetical protein
MVSFNVLVYQVYVCTLHGLLSASIALVTRFPMLAFNVSGLLRNLL